MSPVFNRGSQVIFSKPGNNKDVPQTPTTFRSDRFSANRACHLDFPVFRDHTPPAVCYSGGCRVAADIQPFLKDRSFGADAARVMGEAYDKARRMLHDTGQPHLVQEIIAKKIIDIATTGE